MLNVAAIVGRLAADPELKHTQSGVSVASFTLAVDRSYAKAGTERQTDWIDVVAWRQTAEFVCKYFTKGRQMAVSGSLQTRTWEDKNGSKHKSTELVANDVSFVDSKRDSGSAGGGSYAPSPAPSQPAAFNEPASAYSSGSSEDFEEFLGDDDLPF